MSAGIGRAVAIPVVKPGFHFIKKWSQPPVGPLQIPAPTCNFCSVVCAWPYPDRLKLKRIADSLAIVADRERADIKDALEDLLDRFPDRR